MTRFAAAAFAAVVLVVSTASAQQPPPVRVRGTIEKVDGLTLTVKARDGALLTVQVPENVRVLGIVRIPLTDIKPGTYVGVSAVPNPGGGLKALHVHQFIEAQRGVAEGHRPWDLGPQTTMTNATVAEVVAVEGGQTLLLKYKDGEQRVFVGPDVPVVSYVPGDKSELKPGAQIIIIAAQKQPDGTLSAAAVSVGRGITPPM